MAGHTGRVPLVDDDEVFALLLQLVFEELPEHAKPVVHGGLPKVQRPGHRPQIQILYAYSVVGIGYLPTQLVAEVQALLGGLPVEFFDLEFLLLVVAGPPGHFGQPALLPGQLSLRLAIEVGHPGVLVVAVHIEQRAAVVQPKRPLLIRDGHLSNPLLLIGKEDRDIALPRAVQGDSGAPDHPILGWQPVDHGRHKPQLGQLDLAADGTLLLRRDDLDVVVRPVGRVRLAAALLGLELRVFSPALEEVLVGGVQVVDCVGQGKLVYLAEVGVVHFPDAVGIVVELVPGHGLKAAGIQALLHLQGVVEHLADTAKGLVQDHPLRIRGVDPIFYGFVFDRHGITPPCIVVFCRLGVPLLI